MENKKNLYLFQFNYSYGNDIFIPYSIGILWSYVKQFKVITDHYDNKEFTFMRDVPEIIVSKLVNPKVCAFSCYVWNWEINLKVSILIKNMYPDCLIVFGGPHVPDNLEKDFFEKYPSIDITVHGEGELTFYDILEENLKKEGTKDFQKIQGTTFNNKKGTIKLCERRERVKDINSIPSPYLSGVFDEILKLTQYNFQPTWETNRGCPYSCKFCDWGSSLVTKIKSFDMKRLENEIKWFGEHKISFIFGADANFGIMKRDIELAKKLASEKRKNGFPEKFRVAFAKMSSDRVFEIAKILNNEKMDKGITLSVQSMDTTTLAAVKRKNMKFDSLSQFIVDYQKENIPTYTELIMAMPGETYESFKRGIDRLLDAGIHNSLSIYDCGILPNAPMNDTEYKKFHKLKITRVPIFLNHSVPGGDPVQEYEDIVSGTSTMSEEDYIKSHIFSWIIQTCHTLNLTQFIAVYFKNISGLEYSVFYTELVSFANDNPDTIIGKELLLVYAKINSTLQGKSRDIVLEEFSNITWAMDEASYLRISKNIDLFFLELKEFINLMKEKHLIKTSNQIIDEIITYQESIIVKWTKSGNNEIYLSYPLHKFYRAMLIKEPFKLEKGKFKVKILDDLNFSGDKKRYAKEVIWWGRKGGQFIYKNIEETEVPIGSVINSVSTPNYS